MELCHYKKVNVENLCKYEANSRTHSKEQIQQVADSIKEYGFTNPILIDEHNVIIAGHCRLEAAKSLNLSEVPCIVLDSLTEAQKAAYVIADNKMALNAGWDYQILKAELMRLQEFDFDLSLTGFDDQELAEIFDNTPDAEDVFGEPKEDKYSSVFELIIECTTELEQEKLYKEMSEKGYKCRILSM